MLDDARKLHDKFPELHLTHEIILIAFSHSKELHVKEMEEIDKYSRLTIPEFLEFLSRLAFIIYKDKT